MGLLENTRFLRLWGNQILLQIAFNLSGFTALLLIDHLTSSRFALAQFYASITLPAFLIGVYAGTVIDITNRKKLMLITDAILSFLFLGYIFAGGSFLMILLVAFLASSVAQFFTPAEAATIPLIVDKKHLEGANALFLFTALGSVMIGFALAGPIIQLFGGLEGTGSQAAFAIASASAAIGFFLLYTFPNLNNHTPQLKDKNIVAETWILTKEVLVQITKNPKILLPILILTLVEFNVGMLSIIFIDFVKIYLKLPSTAISYFLILPLVFGLIAGVGIMKESQNWFGRGRSIFAGILLFGLILAGLSTGTVLLETSMLRLMTMLAAFLVGIAVVFIAVHSRTVLQENTPKEMLGRVFAFVTISISATVPIPILLLALLGESVDVATLFMAFGMCLILLSVLVRRPLEKRID